MSINYKNIISYLVVGLLLTTSSCNKDFKDNYSQLNEIPDGFPKMDIPSDNEFSKERWELGKMLFYDKKLSVDSSISCASCHKSSLAFSDDLAKTPGVFNLPGSRNAPTLTNIGFQPYFTKEGGVETLEQQVLIPIEEHNEMGFNILDAGLRLNEIEIYKEKSLTAYGREMDYYVITRAISCFERTLISSNSTYDKWINGEASLSESAIRGNDLFHSNKTNCSSCHSSILFTDFSFQNNGLYDVYSDVGKYRLTNDSSDIGVFKVPTLRNINFTAPYMHDGSISNLKDVVIHYNSGGATHPNKNSILEPLNLNEQEINDLIAFLESLSDYTFINNKLLSDE